MAITRHQRVYGYLWHWESGPSWFRNPPELAPLRQAGMYGLRVQVQDDGQIPRALVDGWRSVGFKVDGMIGHVHEWEVNPEGLAAWMKAERNRLALSGWDCNFEDEVNGFDARSNGQWSVRFANELRRLHPTLPLYLDSYWGPMGDKINLGAYKARGFRFNVQTFWTEKDDVDGLWNDPTTNIVRKGSGAQPVIPRAVLKPIFRVASNNAGQLPDWDVVFTDTKIAGTKGCSFYYLDGAPSLDYVCDLTRRAISSGAAYR
jgi:hypothetical protein